MGLETTFARSWALKRIFRLVVQGNNDSNQLLTFSISNASHLILSSFSSTVVVVGSLAQIEI